MDSTILWWIVAFAFVIIVACFTGYLAKVKGYSYGTWLALGLLFGIFALLVTLGLPKKVEKITGDGSNV